MQVPEAMQLDADFQKAKSYLGEGHIGSAVDLYKSLYERGDYRGIEGLCKIRDGFPDANPMRAYVNQVLSSYEEKHKPVNILMVLYPNDFSFAGLISSAEEQFGHGRRCRKTLDAMRTADWSHPHVVFEQLAKAAGNPKRGKRKALLESIGREIGLDDNAICFFMGDIS